MPFTEDLPAENTDPWYAPLVAAWAALRTFVNGLETAIGLRATTAALTAGLNGKLDVTQRGAANGVASLGADSKLPTSQLPALAVTEYLGAAANQAAMLAKVGEQGDWVTRTDTGTVWVITGANPAQLASWTQLTYPTAPVLSVNGQGGAVNLVPLDIGAASAVDLNNVDGKANQAIADAAAAQTTANGRATVASVTTAQAAADAAQTSANGRATVASVTAAASAAAAAQAKADAAIPSSDIVSGKGDPGVLYGEVIGALDPVTPGMPAWAIIVQETA